MTALGLGLLLLGWLLMYAGLRNISIAEEIRATFRR
jgi:hypothetical protein